MIALNALSSRVGFLDRKRGVCWLWLVHAELHRLPEPELILVIQFGAVPHAKGNFLLQLSVF